MTTHTTQIKVRYAETDRMGVVYYANYFIWFEVARTELLKAVGISYREIEEKRNIYLMVVESRCRYLKPATYDDNITVQTSVSEIKNTSLIFKYKVYKGPDLISEGDTVHVFTNTYGRPTKIPQDIKSLLK